MAQFIAIATIKLAYVIPHFMLRTYRMKKT